MVQLQSAILTAAALFASCATAVTPLAVRGADFVNSRDSSRFQIIGVAYQPGGSAGYNPGSGIDPLSNEEICLRDAILMQRMGINTIRVYNLDPEIDHTPCASIFNAAGIYMVLDVNSPLPAESLNRLAPWQDYYNPAYMERVLQIVESFMNYNNTLGFFSANEIINEESVEQVPQFVRAVTRDIKEYISRHASREIPVGYSAADVRPLLEDTFNYLECNSEADPWSRMDFFGLNSYSWCGDATYESAGYDVLVDDFNDATVPIFFSEYGCNEGDGARPFSEVGAIYSAPFMNTFSGGIVYEWTQEDNDYGLVEFSTDRVDLLQDYTNLRNELGQIDVTALVQSDGNSQTLQAPSCSDVQINSNITSNFTIPERPANIQSFIDNGVPGTYPTGTTTVTQTSEPDSVYDVDGTQLQGLELQILGNDESNLPNSRQVTDPNGTGIPPVPTPSGSSGNNSGSGGDGNAATKGDVKLGVMIAAVVLGLFAQW